MSPEALPTDELFVLERQIARRADEILQGLPATQAKALAAWSKAEEEIWIIRKTDAAAATSPKSVRLPSDSAGAVRLP